LGNDEIDLLEIFQKFEYAKDVILVLKIDYEPKYIVAVITGRRNKHSKYPVVVYMI
jgi:hypothetical protein